MQLRDIAKDTVLRLHGGSTQALEKFKMPLALAGWYLMSIVYSVMNKEVLTVWKFPCTSSAVQLLVGSLWILVMWMPLPTLGLRGKEELHGVAAAGKTLAALDELRVKPSSYNWTCRGKVEGRAGPHVGFGEFLSLSDDGRTMATGAGYPAVSGYIQVFRWQDASVNASWHRPPSWVQLGNDINGTHVHLSKNGLVIAIGRRGSGRAAVSAGGNAPPRARAK